MSIADFNKKLNEFTEQQNFENRKNSETIKQLIASITQLSMQVQELNKTIQDKKEVKVKSSSASRSNTGTTKPINDRDIKTHLVAWMLKTFFTPGGKLPSTIENYIDSMTYYISGPDNKPIELSDLKTVVEKQIKDLNKFNALPLEDKIKKQIQLASKQFQPANIDDLFTRYKALNINDVEVYIQDCREKKAKKGESVKKVKQNEEPCLKSDAEHNSKLNVEQNLEQNEPNIVSAMESDIEIDDNLNLSMLAN